MKLKAAWDGGCRSFDSAMLGYGGCPFAEDDLVGNISTESLLDFLKTENVEVKLDGESFSEALLGATEIFGSYH